MENLLRYFMEETNRKFQDIHESQGNINRKLDDLTQFKIEMVASARLTSFVVSGACGLLSMMISVALAIYFRGK